MITEIQLIALGFDKQYWDEVGEEPLDFEDYKPFSEWQYSSLAGDFLIWTDFSNTIKNLKVFIGDDDSIYFDNIEDVIKLTECLKNGKHINK